MPPGTIPIDWIDQTVAAYAKALPAIGVPEGTTQLIGWVCSAKGDLYVSVDSTILIPCSGSSTVDLAKTVGIKGARKISCPDNKKACPGDKATEFTTTFNNTLEQFEKNMEVYLSTVSQAASVPIDLVVITNVVKLVPKIKPTAGVPASIVDSSTSMEGTRRHLFSDPVITAAKIDVVPDGPKATLAVTTSVQPLTELEAMSVQGTLGSDYFSTTYNAGCAGAGLTIVDQPTGTITTVKEPYVFPSTNTTAKVKGVLRKAVNVTSVNGTLLNANATGVNASTALTPRNNSAVPIPTGNSSTTPAASPVPAASPSPSPAPSSAATTTLSAIASSALAVAVSVLMVMF